MNEKETEWERDAREIWEYLKSTDKPIVLNCSQRQLAGEWIPVNEGLPDRAGTFICTYECKKGRFIEEIFFNDFHQEFMAQHGNVIAWLDIKPYMGD